MNEPVQDPNKKIEKTRIAIISEGDRNEPLHTGKIKKYIGLDLPWTRNPYSEFRK